ncbi:MAG: glycoside hydrolase domain-containing protein, partial [Bacteroidota bacterium]
MLDLRKKIPYVFSIFLCVVLLNSFSHAQQIKYTSGKASWNTDSLGNHRVLVQFTGTGTVAKAIIPWRRRDMNPGQKRIIVQNAKTGQKITNVKTVAVNREEGIVLFEPLSGKGDYYIYYMPYINEGSSNYPKGVYKAPENTATTQWLTTTGNNMPGNCVVKEIESIDAFNSFYPMEVIATAAETKSLVDKNNSQPFLVFPEARENSIRMKYDLPQRWILRGPQNSFTDTALRGEWLAFQLGVFALQDLIDVTVSFSDLTNKQGKTIAANNIACINTDGTKYDGTVFSGNVNVSKGSVQAMWCGIDVPGSTAPGVYTGKAIVHSAASSKEIQLQIKIADGIATNAGIDKPENMTRLKWLNSTLAQENTVIAPYTALEVSDTVISLLGRKLLLSRDGFPAQVQTFFTPEMTGIGTKPNNLFTEPLHFHFYDADGKQPLKWKTSGLNFIKKEAGTVAWQSSSSSASLQMDVIGALEFDGFLSYTVKFTALEDMSFNDINFHLPLQPESAKYLMGLGLKGGNRPDTVQWKWDVAHKNQDGAWIGNINAGLQFSLRDDRYSRPLNTNFYLQKPLILPSSWGNDNKGGIDIFQKGKSILVNAYSGSRSMKKGEVLYYNFNLLITPFHTINTDFQWDARFYHKYKEIDTIRKTGASIINIHHATAINPYINYPFIEFKKMKTYIDEAHSKGLKVKIYNTIRELSNKAYEI